ncbi:MAG: type I-U CRISPR-associated protein Cas7 [Bryobacteraceae bacterium]|nr:type I-U CRISPR-associated protein Cas7 [Bryobacteraceae bacterium]
MSTQQSSSNTQTSQITPNTLLTAPRRWYLRVRLNVAEGFDGRFQPTGFPNLGPALYRAMNNGAPTDYLLVESAQSLANWMETMCLDPQNPCRYNSDCAGIPYVVVREKDNRVDWTSSLTEPHRLASDEIVGRDDKHPFRKILRNLLQVDKDRPVYLPKVAKRLFYIDPACLLHGVFLEKLDGRIRFPRLLSATITAKEPQAVNAGGVMRGYVKVAGPEGSIPYSIQHFASSDINLQLIFHTDTLKAWGLDEQEEKFIAAFALYKVDKLLNSFPRLRTACVLDPDGVPKFDPKLSDTIKAAFTTDRRKKVFGDETLPGPLTDGEKQGFKPFELDRA